MLIVKKFIYLFNLRFPGFGYGFLVVILLFVALIFGANLTLKVAAQQMIRQGTQYLQEKNIKLANSRIESVEFTAPLSLKISDFSTSVLPREADLLAEPKFTLGFKGAHLTFGLAEVKIVLTDFWMKFTETSPMGASKTTHGEFRGEYAQAVIPFHFYDPWATMRDIRKIKSEAGRLLRTGTTALPFEIRGWLKFIVADQSFETETTSKKVGKKYYFMINRDDLLKISVALDEKLTESEVDFVSQHPIQASRLLRLKNYAKKTSEAAAAKDPGIPEDAYRHILWSYLLTKEFGVEFAEEVTDSHEIGDRDEDNTEADHVMDHHNNGIGRSYAQNKFSEDQILSVLMTDPRVIKSAKDVKMPVSETAENRLPTPASSSPMPMVS